MMWPGICLHTNSHAHQILSKIFFQGTFVSYVPPDLSQNTVGQFSISSMVNASVCSGPALNTHSRGFQRSFLLGEMWVQSNGIPKSLCLLVILSNKIHLAFRLIRFFPCVFWVAESPAAFWVGNASNSKSMFL